MLIRDYLLSLLPIISFHLEVLGLVDQSGIESSTILFEYIIRVNSSEEESVFKQTFSIGNDLLRDFI